MDGRVLLSLPQLKIPYCSNLLREHTMSLYDCKTRIAKWKTKRLLKHIASQRGNGTSMITLMIKPSDRLHRVGRMLKEEEGKASHIKSRINRQSVQTALVSARQKLKLYTTVPKNGLAIFCGTTDKNISLAFEPCKPIRHGLYMCDAQFHTESLDAMLADSDQ